MNANDLTSQRLTPIEPNPIRKRLLPGLVLAGMSLGTAWAIRGQFGHEQGAAWAGSIGALSVILMARRADWYNKAFRITLAAALGWGIGGIISYGRVVGFGRGTDFTNVYYGLLMLFIIGGLHGFLGGGLFGLALSDSPGRRVRWRQLLLEMVVGALLAYFFLIEQWGWLMTPPRSELWAACVGMALALTGYLIRRRHKQPLRVAVFAGMGAGFGFAFGDFLQVMGQVSQLQFNFWNVMEYSIGFFGGLGMAYGTFTSAWVSAPIAPERRSRVLLPLLVVAVFIPFVVWDQSFEAKRLEETFGKLVGADVRLLTRGVQWVALALVVALGGLWVKKYYTARPTLHLAFSYSAIRLFFLGHFSLYLLFSLLITGAFFSSYRIEQYLYIINLLIISLLIGKARPGFSPRGTNTGKWVIGLVLVLLCLALLAIIAINSHGEIPGMQRRFE